MRSLFKFVIFLALIGITGTSIAGDDFNPIITDDPYASKWNRQQTLGGSTRWESDSGSTWTEEDTLDGSKRYRGSGGGTWTQEDTLGGGKQWKGSGGGTWTQEETLGGGTRWKKK